MSEIQISLELDIGYNTEPVAVPLLRDEIAAAWSLPLGQRVEVCFRGERSAVTGTLELRCTPEYPWDPRQPLQLGIAGLLFSSREIERWTIYDSSIHDGPHPMGWLSILPFVGAGVEEKNLERTELYF